MELEVVENKTHSTILDAAEIGALAHLYRGEVYRSTLWRTRLDNTTNWSVVTTGIAFSIAFSRPESSPLPLLLVGLLNIVFLLFEARRYRFFNVWRARARHLETQFYAPMLKGKGEKLNYEWNEILADDYLKPRYHISLARAIGRRLRKNYSWLFAIQALAYFGKISIHPTSLTSAYDLVERATIGPLSGWIVISLGLLFHVAWISLAIITLNQDKNAHQSRPTRVTMG